MADDTTYRGRRVTVPVEGERRAGTVTAVTYTLKGGQPVVQVELDEPMASGREQLAFALSNVTFGDTPGHEPYTDSVA